MIKWNEESNERKVAFAGRLNDGRPGIRKYDQMLNEEDNDEALANNAPGKIGREFCR